MIKIAVISATRVSIAPVEQTVSGQFPDAELIHILDEGMSLMAEKSGGIITPSNLYRMAGHIQRANEYGADGILLSCTIFSPYAGLLQNFSEAPLVAADVAAFQKAAGLYKKLGVVVTFKPTLKSVEAVLRECGNKAAPPEADIRLAEGAFEAAVRGDDDTHNRIVRSCAEALAESCDAVVLSQMSQLRALPELSHLKVPVLTTPALSISALMEKIKAGN